MKVFGVFFLYLLGYLDILGTESSSLTILKSVEDHNWKDYNGLIPSNAIAAGTDENGETTYIGQFSTISEYNWIGKAGIHTLPAVIKKGSQYAVAAYNGRALRSNETTNTKVLCYGYSATRYKWYSTSASITQGCRFVVVGYEDEIPMYVGRATQNKETVVGKIFSDTTHHRGGLISPYNGGEIHHDDYTVLTYCD